jgi:hypothetical protein
MSCPGPYDSDVNYPALYTRARTGVKRFTLTNEVYTMNKSSEVWEAPKLVEYDTVVEATGDNNKCGSGTDEMAQQLDGSVQSCEPTSG